MTHCRTAVFAWYIVTLIQDLFINPSFLNIFLQLTSLFLEGR
jgi:hypothetical protein